MIDWLCFLSFAMQATPLVCLLDFICLSTELLFNERVSLRASQRKFPLTTAKCGFGWSFTRSQAHVVFPFPEDEVELPLPRGLYLPSFSRNWSSCRTPKSCPSCYGNLNRVNICIFLVRPFELLIVMPRTAANTKMAGGTNASWRTIKFLFESVFYHD